MEINNDDDTEYFPDSLMNDELPDPQPVADELPPTMPTPPQSDDDCINVDYEFNTLDTSPDLSAFEEYFALWYVRPTTAQWVSGEKVRKSNG